MEAHQRNTPGEDASLRVRRADVSRMLAGSPPESGQANELRSALNEIDRRLDIDRTRDRRAQIESLLSLENLNTSHVPFHDLPEYIASLERLQERAVHRLAGQKPGKVSHQRTQIEVKRLHAELAYYRAVVNDPDLYEELAVAKGTRSHATGKKSSPVTVWVGLVCTVLGGLLLIPTALIGGVMGVAGAIGQVVSGIFLLGVIMLVVGALDARRN